MTANGKAALSPEFATLTMTPATRRVIELAARGGLRPRLGSDGAKPDQHGRVLVYLDGVGYEAMFGGIYVNAQSGKIIRSYLTPGNSGTERCYETVPETRRALTAWFAQNLSSQGRSASSSFPRPQQPRRRPRATARTCRPVTSRCCRAARNWCAPMACGIVRDAKRPLSCASLPEGIR
jgi:hypothetical protein